MNLIHDSESRHQLKCCARVAGESPDPSTQNGAVIVANCGEIVSGCNSPVLDVEIGVLSRTEKLKITDHAECASIHRCAFLGISTNRATMFCLWAPCSPCAVAIKASGIVRLVTLESLYKLTPDRWKEDLIDGLHTLQHGGVVVDFYEGLLGERILFNGQETEI